MAPCNPPDLPHVRLLIGASCSLEVKPAHRGKVDPGTGVDSPAPRAHGEVGDLPLLVLGQRSES